MTATNHHRWWASNGDMFIRTWTSGTPNVLSEADDYLRQGVR